MRFTCYGPWKENKQTINNCSDETTSMQTKSKNKKKTYYVVVDKEDHDVLMNRLLDLRSECQELLDWNVDKKQHKFFMIKKIVI